MCLAPLILDFGIVDLGWGDCLKKKLIVFFLKDILR